MLELARATRPADGQIASDLGAALAEREDLRAALDWAEENDAELGLEIAVAVDHLWVASAPAEGMRRFERLLEGAAAIPPELRARALRAYGGASGLAGHSALGERLAEESLQVFRELGDDLGIATTEHMLAVAAWRREDWARVRRLTDHSLELARGRFASIETADYWLLGQLALFEGDPDRAVELTRRSASAARALGWAWWESGQHHELLMLALRRGDLDEAEQEGFTALRMEREQENRLWALYTLAGLAQVAHARGDLVRAGLLWGAVENEARSIPRWSDERARRGGPLVDESRDIFCAGRARGEALDFWDAALIALGEDAATPGGSDEDGR
jgi:hypothetical protein